MAHKNKKQNKTCVCRFFRIRARFKNNGCSTFQTLENNNNKSINNSGLNAIKKTINK